MKNLNISNQMALWAAAYSLSLGVAVGQSLTFNASPAISSQATDWTASLGFPRFNPTWGTLQSVVLTLSSSSTSSVILINPTGAPKLAGGTVSTVFTPTDSNLSSLGFTGSSILSPKPVPAFSSTTLGPSTYTGSSGSITFTAPSTLGEFTGTTTYDLELTAHGSFVLSGSLNLVAILSDTASANGTVTYNCIPVPEPSAYAAVAGLGLLGFAAFRRTRRN